MIPFVDLSLNDFNPALNNTDAFNVLKLVELYRILRASPIAYFKKHFMENWAHPKEKNPGVLRKLACWPLDLCKLVFNRDDLFMQSLPWQLLPLTSFAFFESLLPTIFPKFSDVRFPLYSTLMCSLAVIACLRMDFIKVPCATSKLNELTVYISFSSWGQIINPDMFFLIYFKKYISCGENLYKRQLSDHFPHFPHFPVLSPAKRGNEKCFWTQKHLFLLFLLLQQSISWVAKRGHIVETCASSNRARNIVIFV